MKTWQTHDRSNWIENLVKDSEPDKAQWIDEQSGYDCLIVRNRLGGLCGYVGVPPEHGQYEKHFEEADIDEQVHGGLSFSKFCDPAEPKENGICHVGEVANEKVWWFGFDCGHCNDLRPKDHHMLGLAEVVYRDFDYVKNEVTQLAEALIETI